MTAMAATAASVNKALDAAEKGLVEMGLYDPETARSLFAGIRPQVEGENVVGNIADLQKAGVAPATAESPQEPAAATG